MKKPKPCAVPGCLRIGGKAHGLCDAHYARLKRTGSVQAEVPLLVMNRKTCHGALAQILRGTRKSGG